MLIKNFVKYKPQKVSYQNSDHFNVKFFTDQVNGISKSKCANYNKFENWFVFLPDKNNCRKPKSFKGCLRYKMITSFVISIIP